MKERAIKSAYDRRSGRNLDAEEEFRSAKQAHVLREQYNNGELDLYCCECGQPLHISKSIYDRVYFKHAPYAAYCVLKDSHFSVGDMELIRKAIYARESERHKYLKRKIADLLSSTHGVDQSSVIVDNKFIFDNENKRRPDVYCVYQDKQLVFEIQLSPLPLRYLLHRHNFYKNKGIFLIWILDDFDVYGQRYWYTRYTKQTSPHLGRPALVPMYLQKLPVFFARKRVHANFYYNLFLSVFYVQVDIDSVSNILSN